MDIRYYMDSDSGFPHIYRHGITEAEVEWILSHAAEDESGARGSRHSLGQTQAGRFLRVIYVPDEDGSGIFVVTAYSLFGKPLQAFRKRQRRRGK